jgi:hypothetical protein
VIARNPARNATRPRPAPHEVNPPTVDGVWALIDAARAKDPGFGVYLWLLAVTGCRRGAG